MSNEESNTSENKQKSQTYSSNRGFQTNFDSNSVSGTNFKSQPLNPKAFGTKPVKHIRLRIVICFLAVYLGIAISLAVFNTKNYTYTKQNFLFQSLTVVLQPFMEIAGSGKTGHQYNWENFRPDKIPNQIETTKITSKSPNPIYFEPGFISSLKQSLDPNMETVVLKPADRKFKDEWSLVFCQTFSTQSTNQQENDNQKQCFQNTLKQKGSVKMLIIGTGEVWGLDKDGKLFDLYIESYLPRTERSDLLFV